MARPAAAETSLFRSSISTVDGNSSINNDETDYPSIAGEFDENAIFARLNELRQWQESQRQILANSQLDQQKLLQLEKQKLYDLFGLDASIDNANEDKDDECSSNDFDYTEGRKLGESNAENISPNIIMDRSIERSKLELQSPSISQLNKIIKNMAVRSPAEKRPDGESNANIVKWPFLKRGEGLKNRFKISPDAFRLNNLPKYKYADRIRKHAQSASLQQQKRHQNNVINVSPTTTTTAAGASVEGHQNNANQPICKEKTYGEQQNTKKLRSDRNNFHPKTVELKLKPTRNLHENHYQQKSNSISSLQDVSKKLFDSSRNQDGYAVETLVPSSISSRNKQNPLSPTTKLILDTPIRNKLQLQQNEINELQHFEQLEKDLNETVNHRAQSSMAGNRDDNLVLQFKVGLNLSPQAYFEVANNESFPPIDSVRDHEKLRARYSNESTTSDESKHVRFAADEYIEDEKHLYQNVDANGQSSIATVDETMANTSSPNEKSTESFRKFKEKLFDRKLKQKFKNQLSVAKDFEISDLNSNKGDDDDSSLMDTIQNAAALAADNQSEPHKQLIQDRLTSLEKEIQSFRDQNAELTKLIREHELIRLTFDQERAAEQERMENERIQFEMYKVDERMKLLAEHAEREKKMKDARALTKTEKDEVARLRTQCANHEAELNAREQKHVAAQARIRAQLRNIEKEFKELRFEVENLRRDNKKLETENTRLRRQGNNKILHEINRNLNKLAQPGDNVVNNNHSDNVGDGEKVKHGVKKCSNKNAHKTVVAKVTSHREPVTTGRLRSKSVPNLQQNDSNEKYSYELSSSMVSCDGGGENSDCSSSEETQTNKNSNYFPMPSSHRPKKVVEAKRSSSLDQSDNEAESKQSGSSKRIIENPDGSKDVWYPNGNLKKISADGMCTRMLYFNKDIKETDLKEGIVKYYYAETNTWQTSYLDGLDIFEYPDGQTEHRFKDGTIEIHFPNGAVRITNPLKEQNEGIKEEWKYPDGTNVVQLKNGERILLLPNGQREVHTNGHKRREYPDGTVKIVYPDGSQETRYSNGRVRLKNKEGKLIMDSETISI